MNKRTIGVVFVGAALLMISSPFNAAAQKRDDRGRDDRDHRQDAKDRHDDEKADYHFRNEDRNQFASHYRSNIKNFQKHPDKRRHIRAGEQLPPDYRSHLKPVPSSYYRNVPPPPRGYQMGYYDGYVVAYNPTTRIVADVLDLVAAISR